MQPRTNALTQQQLRLFTQHLRRGDRVASSAKSLSARGRTGQGGITATPAACAPEPVPVTLIQAGLWTTPGWTRPPTMVWTRCRTWNGAVYKAVQGRFKVFMIDEVHVTNDLQCHAQDAGRAVPEIRSDRYKNYPSRCCRPLPAVHLRPMAPDSAGDTAAHYCRAGACR